MRALIAALALLFAGCFSQDDFRDCVAPGQCGVGPDGRGRLCVDGQCLAPAIDGEGDDVITLSGRLGDVHSHPERTVVIEDVEVANLNLRVEADVIILIGSITGDGGGFAGGEGGRNGAVGMSGEPGARGEPARQDTEAGGPGGEPGTARAEPGGAGAGGVYQESEPCRIGFNFVLAGSGGGGGGGGAGGACRGSRGGAGGPGGAAVLLRATRFIELRGPISVRGADGQGPEERVCGDSGLGGPGGGGAGGLVYLEAPTVLYSQGAAVDVSGAPGASGGLVTVFGTVEGVYRAPAGIDDDRVCQVPLAQ